MHRRRTLVVLRRCFVVGRRGFGGFGHRHRRCVGRRCWGNARRRCRRRARRGGLGWRRRRCRFGGLAAVAGGDQQQRKEYRNEYRNRRGDSAGQGKTRREGGRRALHGKGSSYGWGCGKSRPLPERRFQVFRHFSCPRAGTSLAGVRQGSERGKQAENARHGDGGAPSAGRYHHVLERRRGDVRHSLLSKRAWLQRYGWQPVLIARRCRAARHASGRFVSHQSRRAGGPGCGSARRHGAAGSVRGAKMARLQSPDASTFGERCAAVSGERVSLRKILPISWCGAPGS